MNDITNQNYIKEMEKNSKIFEEKMNKLNSDYSPDKSEFNTIQYSKGKNPFKNAFKNKQKLTTDLNINKLYNSNRDNFQNSRKSNGNNLKYNNTISTSIFPKRQNNKKILYLNTDINNNSNGDLIEELKADIKEKLNIIN